MFVCFCFFFADAFSLVTDSSGRMTRIRLDMFVQELLVLPAAVFESPSFEYTEGIARTLFDQVCSCISFHASTLFLLVKCHSYAWFQSRWFCTELTGSPLVEKTWNCRGIIQMSVKCQKFHCKSGNCQGKNLVMENCCCGWHWLRATTYAVSTHMLSQFRLSVHLSHGWISQKRLKLGSCNFHRTVAPSL